MRWQAMDELHRFGRRIKTRGTEAMSKVSRLVTIIVVSLIASSTQLPAQPYPDRVVRIINPYPPGGSVDVMARILAQKLSDNLGQQFIVENRSGGGGNTGSDFVAKAEPDGYTLLFTAPGPLTVNQTLYSKLSFDPAKDFAPIALFATAPIVLIVNPAVPANNVQELIALARKEPGKINFASAGNGTTNHLSGELFKSMAKIDIVHVPYRGAGPAMNDLVAGHVQMFFDLMPVVLPQINARHVRALGNAGSKRPTALPDVPTIAEQGLAGFDASSWYGLVAPAKTPEPVLAKLRDEVAKALKTPDMVARIRELGSEPGTMFGAEFGTFMAAETKKWAEVIHTSGAKAD
jgi:tripartite-type tricarboxylate transporter receptor subunit TctC